MLRFASSPAGDMHIGDLRIALFNYILSQQKKEDFIVRIEDIEKENIVEGKDQEILDILDLFNIKYSQTIYQSEGVRFHSAMALQLMHEKKAFSCFCSDEWIDKKRKEAKENNQPYLYDEACANLPAELVIDNLNPFSIRIKKPAQETSDIDSFIILNQNKVSTHNFACAVDDMLNNISTVVSDENHKANSLKQEHVRDSLKYDKKVHYIYLPTMADETPSVKQLLEDGFLPDAISNYLISTAIKLEKEFSTLKEAAELLSFENMSSSSVHFDIDTLKHINREHLKALNAKELSRYVGFADEDIGNLGRVYLDEVSTTKELKSKITPIFAPKKIPQELQEKATLMQKAIKAAPYFEEYSDFQKYILKELDFQDNDFVQVFRLVLTGSLDGPDIAEVYKYLKNYIGEIIK